MTVSQNTISGLIPGGSVALSGKIVNEAGPDAKVGSVLGTVTSVGGDIGSIADYWISGTAVVDANVPTGTTGITWSGLTLHYANSANNQNSGKGKVVNIGYTLTDTPVITGLGHKSGPWTGAGVGNTAEWANTDFDQQWQLIKQAGGYQLVSIYNGTFTGNAGIASPNGSGVMGAGITGTLGSVWKANLVTTAVAHQSTSCMTSLCTRQEFMDASGLSTVPGIPWADWTWTTTFNAGPDHGSYVATSVSPRVESGDEVAVGTGDIK
jgi:hypothetical protein